MVMMISPLLCAGVWSSSRQRPTPVTCLTECRHDDIDITDRSGGGRHAGHAYADPIGTVGFAKPLLLVISTRTLVCKIAPTILCFTMTMAGRMLLYGGDLFFANSLWGGLWGMWPERDAPQTWHHHAASPIRPIQRICQTRFEGRGWRCS
jgi:hypothetical protein